VINPIIPGIFKFDFPHLYKLGSLFNIEFEERGVRVHSCLERANTAFPLTHLNWTMEEKNDSGS
jgi:hypothetical protein